MFNNEKNRNNAKQLLEELQKEGVPFDVFDLYFRKATLVYDLNALTLKYAIDMATAERAKEVGSGFEKLIGYAVALSEHSAGEEIQKFNANGLEREITRAMLLKQLPSQNDASLVFESSPEKKTIAESPIGLYLYFKIWSEVVKGQNRKFNP